MFRSKLIVKNFTTCSQISPKCRPTPLVCGSDIAAFSCLPIQKLLLDTQNDINGFKNFKFIAKIPIVGSGEKYFSKFTDAKCWNCEKYLEIKNFACTACGALQHPKKKLNHFELFGFSQSFDINAEELSRTFKRLQSVFHPDKFAGKTKAEKDISETYSRLVNKAYTTLKDPLDRGFYLLALQKYPECNAPLEQEFLKDVMAKNEELECLNNERALDKFMMSVKKESEGYLDSIRQAFKSGNLHEAKLNLSKLKYYASMNSRAKEKINELQDKKIK